MRSLAAILTIAALALVPAVAQAKRLPPGPYRTDRQAERFLDRTRPGSGSFCINGFYSRHEQRTGRHFPQRHRKRFRSFTCTAPAGRRGLQTVQLYLQTRPHGRWVVQRDR